VEILTPVEHQARAIARRIVADLKQRGEVWPWREVARFVRQADPRIPEHVALAQAEFIRE
jgi:hypothetical protein